MHRAAASRNGYPLAFNQRSSASVVAFRGRSRSSFSPVDCPWIAALSGRLAGGNGVRASG
ncbi:MAG: hypothetical protein OXH69_00435 [Acidobacteria bacterium]|nr:hypothetical protein [Acidobacteriota bacterium]